MEQREIKYNTFISYSREDKKIVEQLVGLIRAVREEMVFYDVRDIKAGKKWRIQLMQALNDSKFVIVFWCKHAASSKSVKEEYETASRNNKDILPVLLDDKPLPRKLASYQYYDMRPGFSHSKKKGLTIVILITLLLLVPFVYVASFTDSLFSVSRIASMEKSGEYQDSYKFSYNLSAIKQYFGILVLETPAYYFLNIIINKRRFVPITRYKFSRVISVILNRLRKKFP